MFAPAHHLLSCDAGFSVPPRGGCFQRKTNTVVFYRGSLDFPRGMTTKQKTDPLQIDCTYPRPSSCWCRKYLASSEGLRDPTCSPPSFFSDACSLIFIHRFNCENLCAIAWGYLGLLPPHRLGFPRGGVSKNKTEPLGWISPRVVWFQKITRSPPCGKTEQLTVYQVLAGTGDCQRHHVFSYQFFLLWVAARFQVFNVHSLFLGSLACGSGMMSSQCECWSNVFRMIPT